jgi:hypothetical protein
MPVDASTATWQPSRSAAEFLGPRSKTGLDGGASGCDAVRIDEWPRAGSLHVDSAVANRSRARRVAGRGTRKSQFQSVESWTMPRSMERPLDP